MELTDLINKFRTLTRDKSLPYLWDDDDITLWLNESEDEASLRARLLYDKTSSFCTIDVTAGTTVYALDPLINEIEYAYLETDAGVIYVLHPVDRIHLNTEVPYWREDTFPPKYLIQDEQTVEIAGTVPSDYTLHMEVYRKPLKNIEDTADDTPEIADHHHKYLVYWAMHRAYLVNDADKYDAKLSKQYEDEFEKYFGIRPMAGRRIKEQANRHHGNKVWI